ncbi:hypothetical protein G6F16_012571 [Rhizopus arrhizus]|nr:hypothetical protein G6F16_012571 [Rhizopus arrhizus]
MIIVLTLFGSSFVTLVQFFDPLSQNYFTCCYSILCSFWTFILAFVPFNYLPFLAPALSIYLPSASIICALKPTSSRAMSPFTLALLASVALSTSCHTSYSCRLPLSRSDSCAPPTPFFHSIHPSRNIITPLTTPSSIQTSSSNPVSKIQEETTTHSKISNQEPISSSSSTASTKRTLSDRSPQLQPFDQVSRPNRKLKSHNIDFIMNPQATLDFGPTQQPTHQSPVLTVDQPLDFGLPSSVPDWFRPFQARLLHVESLVQENQCLREELKVAQARIAELEAPQAQQPQQQPKPSAGTEASKQLL